ncbi:Rossmann-like and DUF2520 domain-containing protein [Acanthopleuribacter pedis]|uniref:DUF2520 domain-containing protein n=1 Tax=Acanthopleuribacter pedis TaxID=442870 RepID=A0A8J7U581_9BACT|nr:Rossmann-like and DUF2520 domain-containing protein [Acanthopleuribacter pedis]MBO1320203.1 DUF2520 domain-containing protein [Acanthopleuribacter pedis]
MTQSVGIIGMGRLGCSLATSLRDVGRPVQERRRGDAQPLAAWLKPCSVVCLTVRDDELAPLVAELAAFPMVGKTVLIFSGATPLSVAKPLENVGAVIGKLHPLQTFAQRDRAPMPPDTHYAYEGEVAALVTPWVQAWGGRLHQLTGDQWARYHTAAVYAANFLPLMIRAGCQLLAPLAADRQDALDWLAPLIQNSVANALDGGQDLPFSGPAIRGDAAVVARQAELLEQLEPELADLYRLASQMVAAKSGHDVAGQ